MRNGIVELDTGRNPKK